VSEVAVPEKERWIDRPGVRRFHFVMTHLKMK